jgi:hypothetical protein
MSDPAQGKGRDPSLPAPGPVGTTGIDGKANAAGRRRCGAVVIGSRMEAAA